MTEDPYPNGRPDPREDGPYSDDPYVPKRPDQPAYGPPVGGPQPGGPPPAGPPPGYGQVPGYGQPPGAGYPHVPPPYIYPPPRPLNTSTIVLTVVSGFLTFSGLCCYVSLVSLVFAILGLTKNATDPEGAERMTKYGWISLAIITVLTIIGWVGFISLTIWADSA